MLRLREFVVKMHVAVLEGTALLFLARQAAEIMRSCYFVNSSILGVCPMMTSVLVLNSKFPLLLGPLLDRKRCMREAMLCSFQR
jgi:hypothetical protein